MKIEIITRKTVGEIVDVELRKQAKSFYRLLNKLKERVSELEGRK